MTLQYKQTHSGQKRAYGDSFNEYEVTSELPIEEVEKLCCEEFKCSLSQSQYKADLKEDSGQGNYFRTSYTIRRLDENTYKYVTCFPYTG